MYTTGRDFLVIDIYRSESIKRAEDDRIIRSITKIGDSHPKLHHSILIRFGSWMEAIGCRIKSRYVAYNDLEIQVASKMHP